MASSNNPNDVGSVKRNSSVWKLPENEEFWELGTKAKWPVLEYFLDSSGADGLYVEDQASERTLTELQRLFNASSNATKWGIVHHFVGNLGGDNASLLKRVLALGIEPDLETDGGCRPSHQCGGWAWPESAKAIALCRPSLTAVNSNGDAPRAAAARTDYANNATLSHELQEPQLKLRRPAVLKVWDELEKSGFPSLARMASKRQWWAVKNLCRRRLISDQEALEKYDGKTAVEWALAFGEMRLAQELCYFLNLELRHKKVAEDTVAAELASLRTLVNDLIIQNDEKDRSRPEPAAPSVPDTVKEYISQLGAQVAEIEGKLEEKERSFSRRMESLRTEMRENVSSNASAGADNCRSGRKRDESTQPRAGDKNTDQIASFAGKRVEALARTSPEFLGRIFELLNEYEA